MGLRILSVAGGVRTPTKKPRKLPDNATNFIFSGSTKIPRKTHENGPSVRKCFGRNDSEPRKPHENSTKSPRKLHERATNFKNSGSSACPWRVVRESPRILWNFGHQTCARGAKNTRPHDESACATCCPNTSAIKKISEASGFHTGFFHMFCGLPTKGTNGNLKKTMCGDLQHVAPLNGRSRIHPIRTHPKADSG